MQRGFNRGFCLFIARIAYPHFGHDKEFFAGDPTFLNSVAYTLLIAIDLGSINHSVTYRNSIVYAMLAFFGVYLVYTITQ